MTSSLFINIYYDYIRTNTINSIGTFTWLKQPNKLNKVSYIHLAITKLASELSIYDILIYIIYITYKSFNDL